MKINNNNQITFINLSLLSIILICLALDKCVAHPNGEVKSTSSDAHSPKPSDSKAPSSEAHDAQGPVLTSSKIPNARSPTSSSSEAPNAQSPTSSVSFPPEGAQGNDDANAPEAQSPNAQSPSSGDSSGYSSSFSGAFSDILKGEESATKSPTEGNTNAKNDKNSVVEKACAHTQYPDICTKTIQPLLEHHNIKVDINKVLEFSIKACAHQVKLTITKVEMHAAKSPELADALVDCKEKYHNALKSLKSAIRCIPDHNIGKLTVTLSSVMADVSTCESKFEDLKSPSATSQTDGLVSIMVNNCLSIASLVRN